MIKKVVIKALYNNSLGFFSFKFFSLFFKNKQNWKKELSFFCWYFFVVLVKKNWIIKGYIAVKTGFLYFLGGGGIGFFGSIFWCVSSDENPKLFDEQVFFLVCFLDEKISWPQVSVLVVVAVFFHILECVHLKKNTEQDDKENYIKMIRRGEIRRPIIRRILLLLKILHLMLVIICVSILFFWNWWFHPCFWFFNFCGNICWRGKNMSWGDFILHKGGELLVEEEGGSCCVANANFFSLIYSAAGGASPASASSVVASEVQRVKLSRKSCMINVESL